MPEANLQGFAQLTAGGSATLLAAVSGWRTRVWTLAIGYTGSSSSNVISVIQQTGAVTATWVYYGTQATCGLNFLDFRPGGWVSTATNTRFILNSSGTGTVTAWLMGVTSNGNG